MKYVQLVPREESHTNRAYVLPGLKDLPATAYAQDGNPCIASCYRVSFFDRLRFIFSGKITVSLQTDDLHPPIAVGIGNMFGDF